MSELRNLIRVGTVSSVDAALGTVRVTYADKDDMVSDELPVLRLGGTFMMPDPGDRAVCLFLGNGLRSGFYLGTYYTDDDRPPEHTAGNIVLDGPVDVKGSLTIEQALNVKEGTEIDGNVRMKQDVTIDGMLHGGGI